MSETALLAATFGIDAFGSISSAISESSAIKSQADYQAQQLEFNAKLADLQAKQTEEAGKEAARQKKLEAKQVLGKQRAALAAQGIDVSTGTPLLIQEETTDLYLEDVMNIRINAFREASGYRIESIQSRGQAELTKIAGRNASRQTLISGGMKALGSATQGLSLVKTAPTRGVTLGGGTTTQGYKVPSRYIPSR